jgi:hypothetical protein
MQVLWKMPATGDSPGRRPLGGGIRTRLRASPVMCVFVVAVIAVSCCLRDIPAQPTAPPTGSTQEVKAPVPSAEARRQSMDRVKEVFREDFAKATTLPKKRELARALFEQAAGSEVVADRWVMLAEAMRLATESTDADTALDAMDAIGSQFALPDPAWRLDALAKLAPKASAEAGQKIAAVCLETAKHALADKQDQIALKAVGVALGIARRNRDDDLIARVTRFQQGIRDRERLEKELEPLLRKVAESPKDPEANTAAGVALCLKASRWERGLPMLARSDERLLAVIAANELAESHGVKERVALGDQWWDWADTQKSPLHTLAQARAVHHYTLAVNEIQGLDRVRLEKRIDAVQRQSGGTGEMIFLADITEKEVSGQEFFAKGNNTARGGKFTVGGKSFEKAVTATPKGPGETSAVKYTIPSGGRRCRGKAALYRPDHAKPGEQPKDPILFEIVVDGESLWRSPPLRNLDDTAAFDVDLGTGRTLELRMHYPGSNWCAWGTWLDPAIVK